ncbi:hypothetical protein SALBM311S_10184 [Streptomyces alboniger]
MTFGVCRGARSCRSSVCGSSGRGPQFARKANQLAAELDAEGARRRAETHPRRPCRPWTSADEVFARRKAENVPDDWRSWFRLAMTARPRRHPGATQRAIALHARQLAPGLTPAKVAVMHADRPFRVVEAVSSCGARPPRPPPRLLPVGAARQEVRVVRGQQHLLRRPRPTAVRGSAPYLTGRRAARASDGPLHRPHGDVPGHRAREELTRRSPRALTTHPSAASCADDDEDPPTGLGHRAGQAMTAAEQHVRGEQQRDRGHAHPPWGGAVRAPPAVAVVEFRPAARPSQEGQGRLVLTQSMLGCARLG